MLAELRDDDDNDDGNDDDGDESDKDVFTIRLDTNNPSTLCGMVMVKKWPNDGHSLVEVVASFYMVWWSKL